jgi:hypothetical protein
MSGGWGVPSAESRDLQLQVACILGVRKGERGVGGASRCVAIGSMVRGYVCEWRAPSASILQICSSELPWHPSRKHLSVSQVMLQTAWPMEAGSGAVDVRGCSQAGMVVTLICNTLAAGDSKDLGWGGGKGGREEGRGLACSTGRSSET